MKKLLAGAATVLAVAAMSTTASAQGYLEREGNGNPGPGYSIYLWEAHGDTQVAQTEITAAFTLTGTVNKDCSYFLGAAGDASPNQTKSINLGVIGVKTGNNESVNNAFDMVGQAEADVDSTTAGCNTNNTITIEKDDVLGLVNSTPGGYDNTAFQANLPYIVEARWSGANSLSGPTAPVGEGLWIQAGEKIASKPQGAWRSRLLVNFKVPVADKALVAGQYTGTTTVTLKAH